MTPDDDGDVVAERRGACNRMTFNVGMAEGEKSSVEKVVADATTLLRLLWMPLLPPSWLAMGGDEEEAMV